MAEGFLAALQQRPGESLLDARNLERDPYRRITWTPAAGKFCAWYQREVDRQSPGSWDLPVDASED